MAEVNGFVLLVLILLALTTVAGFALFATVEWGGNEIFDIQTFRFKSCTDGIYLLPNGDGTYRIERNEEKETFFTRRRSRKERMTTTTQSRTIYVPEDASVLDAFLQKIDASFEDCHDVDDCRSLLVTRNDDMIWFMKKAYHDIASEHVDDIRDRLKDMEALQPLHVVIDNPLTLHVGGDENMKVGTPELPLYHGYILTLLAYKLDDRPLPQVVDGEDYVTITDPSSP